MMKGLLVLSAASCFASFLWSIRYFFKSSKQLSGGMKGVALFGAIFMAWQMGLLLLSPAKESGWGLLALALYLFSLVLFWWSIRVNLNQPLTYAYDLDQPRHLVQEGPYRLLRHPFYTAYSLTWMAGVLATEEPWLLSSVLVMGLFYWKAALQEEQKFMASSLGADYQKYRAQTGMFLPRFLRTKNWV
jgi:protein-S-isoprenylcysteine O-methyltransferase Ste14